MASRRLKIAFFGSRRRVELTALATLVAEVYLLAIVALKRTKRDKSKAPG